MSTPSSRKTLSKANAPDIVTWLLLGVLLVRPGANSAMRDGVRPMGSFSTSSCRRLKPAVGLEIIDGVWAVTSTVSLATRIGCKENSTQG